MGHGDYNRWGTWNASYEDFMSSEINNMDDNTCALFFSVTCLTGNIRHAECMLEAFTRAQNGSVGFIGATEETFDIANHSYNKYLFTKLLNDSVYQIGNLNVAAHIQNMSPWSGLAEDNAYCYICGCDPTLEIWTAVPQNISEVEMANQNGIVSITTALNDYNVSVVSEDGVLLNKITTSSNVCTFSSPATNYYIVINKHNYYPYIIYYDSTSNYIQNKTFGDNCYYENNPMEIGYDVTNTISYGNVIVEPDSYLKVKNGNGDVIIKNGFECQQGGTFEIK